MKDEKMKINLAYAETMLVRVLDGIDLSIRVMEEMKRAGITKVDLQMVLHFIDNMNDYLQSAKKTIERMLKEE